MKWYEIATMLSITYIIYVIGSQYLSTNYKFDPLTIMVNTLVIGGLLCIFFFPNKIHRFDIDDKSFILLILGITVVFSDFFLQLGVNNKLNLGMIEGLAISIYLPIITIILYMFFNNSINLYNFLGIILISIGSFFILSY